MSNRYLDKYKLYKNIATDDTSLDDLLNQLLDSGETYFKSYNIYLEEETVTFKYNGNGDNMLTLPTLTIQSIEEIKIGGVSIDLINFYREGNLLYYIGNVFIKGIQNIEVTLKVGYTDVDSTPDDLLLALLIFVDKLYESVKNNENSVSYMQDSVGGNSHYTPNLPKNFYVLIKPYEVIRL